MRISEKDSISSIQKITKTDSPTGNDKRGRRQHCRNNNVRENSTVLNKDKNNKR